MTRTLILSLRGGIGQISDNPRKCLVDRGGESWDGGGGRVEATKLVGGMKPIDTFDGREREAEVGVERRG